MRKSKKLFNLEIEFGTIFSCNLTKIPEVMVNKTIKAVKNEQKRKEEMYWEVPGTVRSEFLPKLKIKIEPHLTNNK